jgi:hemerythrin-like domain-containing protein
MRYEGKRLDLTMMFAVHDAFRRDLQVLERLTSSPDDDPRLVLREAVGWELFKRHLRVHHTSEDVALWPAMERLLAGREPELELMAAMEAEHSVIDPLLAGVDAALTDRDGGPDRLGAAVAALSSALQGHLGHEERDALPLIDATLPEGEWSAVGQEHAERIGDGASRYLPWVLDDLDPAMAARLLGGFPAPLVQAYETEWRPAYEALNLWPRPTAR